MHNTEEQHGLCYWCAKGDVPVWRDRPKPGEWVHQIKTKAGEKSFNVVVSVCTDKRKDG